jgi:hypothetical protein
VSDFEWTEQFTPAEARDLIDRLGLNEAVDKFMALDRKLRGEYATWLKAHGGMGQRQARRDERERVAAESDEIGRRVVLLHRVNRAVYGGVL